ncbi:T6SS effector amidase Tae4 family protein [Xylanibacter caecicola]|uniref:T6SS effector amidase Tae4 family protein n=1 Tax=Xylanibacter caecicola TaxID=2736294 RepID=UPI002594DE0B|nr:T6SS effector amidase Tae4 family protein [Xylanibacter caecicola]
MEKENRPFDSSFQNQRIAIGDFNGDGQADFIAYSNNNKDLGYKVYIKNNLGLVESPVRQEFIIPEGDDHRRIEEVRCGDFNGDGYDDVVVLRSRIPFYALDLYLSKTDVNGNVVFEFNKTIIPALQWDHTMTVMDANSDGAADLFLRESNFYGDSYYTLLSSSTDTGVDPLAIKYRGNIEKDEWNGHVSLIDLDGDGMCEILNVRSKDDFANKKKACSPLYRMLPSGEIKSEIGLTLFQSDYYCMGDFNGDGKTDIITMGTTEDDKVGWEVNFATGSKPIFNATTITKLFNPKDKKVYAVDINGDGYDDIYAINLKTVNRQKKPIDIYINDGTGKNFHHYYGSDVYGTDLRKYEFADFSGDGKTDIICFAPFGVNDTGYEIYDVTGIDNHFLTSITDGMGNTTKIEYRRLTDPNVFTRGKKTDYPLVSITCPWLVVSNIYIPDGIGGKTNMEYRYVNALMHKRGRGMLCFEKFVESNKATGMTTTSNYEIIASEMVPVIKSAKTTIKGRLVKETEYTNSLDYQFYNTKKEVSFTCIPKQVVERSYEYNTGTLVSDITTNTEYDKYGNATKTTVTSGGRTVTTENTYTNDETRWLLGRLTKAVVTKDGNGESIALTSEFNYDSNTGLLISESFEPDNVKGYVKTYRYDRYGNVLEDITVPNDGSSSQSHKTEYSSDGRFKIKSINALGFETVSTVDNVLGVETSTTDINGLSCTYTHNGFGELTGTTTPLGETSMIRAWSNGHEDAPTNALYYIKTVSTGCPAQWEFFDCLGRTLRKVSTGMDGRKIYVDAVYNNKGQLVKSSEPYFKGETAYWNTTEYDNAGRTVKETNAEGHVTSVSYNGLTTATTDPLNHTSSKTIDLNGNLMESADAMGNSVTFRYDVNGNCTETTGPRTTVTVEYDELGNKTKMSDPDLGTIEYGYNSFGELVWQKDSKGTTTFEYDAAGRLIEECRPDFTYTHVYDTKWKGALSVSSCSNGMSHEYFYDNYGRVIRDEEVIAGETFTTSNTYNAINKVDVITYPAGFQVKNIYSTDGYLTSVVSNNTGNDKVYWKAGKMNAKGQLESEILGNGLTVSTQYNLSGTIGQISVPGIISKSYTYDAKNNLLSRSDGIRSLTENFEYDSLDRLIKTSGTNTGEQITRYDNAGNITHKTGVGNIYYTNGTNRISSTAGGSYSLPVWDGIEYTSFNKISNVRRDILLKGMKICDELKLQYGTEKTRKIETIVNLVRRWNYNKGDDSGKKIIKTKYYVGNLYEKEINESDTREINYIFANGKVVAVYEKSEMSGESELYVHHDHLGSVMAYSSESGMLIEELSYDAWGRRRNPNTWEYYDFSDDGFSVYDRGFTGHEHIDRFDLINMDGRMYDPVVGRFFSPDPYVQAPDFTQSLNRYAYCINNPLSLTDPSGYNWIENTFATIVGIAVGIETGGLASGVYGAIVGGALGGASASLMSSILNGANLWQTAKGTFTGAFWGAASGTMNFEIGNIESIFARIAAHTAAEGAMEGIRGGHVEHGLLMGFTSSTGGALLEKYSFYINNVTEIVLNATLTGLVTEVGGGKFCNGAMTGAFYALFNDLRHKGPTRKQLEKIYKIETASIEDMSPEDFYDSLGGEIAQKAKDGKWANACAARLSYAMNNAGMRIPYWKGVTLKDKYGNNYITLASDMIKYFKRIWGQGLYCKSNWVLKNGIVGQTGFAPPVSGHVDIIYNGHAAGGALEYFHEKAKTYIWKYGR